MRVLIVEDDPHFAAILGEVLRSEAYEVEIRDRAESAHVSVEAQPPDLAIVDVNLPGRSGIDLVKALRRREASNQLPVILMSAVHRAENRLLRQAIDELKITKFLPKPFSVLDLASTVQAVIAQPVPATPHLVTDAPDSFDADAVQMEPADLRSWDAPPADPPAPAPQVAPESLPPPSVPSGQRHQPVGGAVTRFSHEQVQITGEATRVESSASVKGEPVPEILRLLAEIWSQGRSGVLRVPGRSDWALFAAGHPVDELAETIALAALVGGRASFHPIEHSAVGTSVPILKHLWKAAGVCAQPDQVRGQLHLALFVGNKEALAELPLRPEVRWLLETHKAERTLRKHLDKEQLDLVDVLDDLSRLVVMGLASLGSPAEQSIARPRRERAPRPPTPAPAPAPRDPAPRRATPPPPEPEAPRRARRSRPRAAPQPVSSFEALATLKRLRKEVARLETADAWTILGMPPTEDQALIERAARRMIARYRDIARNPSYSDEVHKLAREVGGKVKQAVGDVKSGAATPVRPKRVARSVAPSDELEAFQLGMEALANEDFGLAARYFTAARDFRIDNPRNLAYLGWATWHDRSRPKEKRRADALELLQLADSFDSSMAQPQYFLAYCEARSGQARFARARLARLLQENPEHVEARRLLKRLKEKAAQEAAAQET